MTKSTKPATIRLTERTIKQIEPPSAGNRITYDEDLPGFGLRTTAAGARSFVLTYWIDGRQRRMTIGKWPSPWNATAARVEAEKLRKRIYRGEDPLEKKQQRRAAETFGEVATEYLERYAIHKRSGHVDRQYLERDVLPLWKNRKAEDLKRADVWRLIRAKADSGHAVAANRLLALIRKVFNWAIYDDDAENCRLKEPSPCHRMKLPGGKEIARERMLTENEIRVLWTALESGLLETDDGEEPAVLTMSPAVRGILRLILATAQRPGECCGLEWSEIDDSGEWWTIPASKAKNKRAHRVPLTALAREILKAQPREGRYVFPSPRGERAIEVNALTHALRNNEHFGLAHFTAHDLRRTASDSMASMGIDWRSRAAVLNHKPSDVTEKHYTVYTFDAEKKAALEKWGRKLRAIVTGKAAKVVSIG